MTIYIYTEQNINATLLFCPHFSWAELKDLRLFLCRQKAYFTQILFTILCAKEMANGGHTRYWLVSEPSPHFGTITSPHDHHLMLQHDNARPHVARICTQFLEAENIPVSCLASILTGHVTHWACWDALDRRIRQRVPVPANIQQLRTAIEEEWTTFHSPQSICKSLWLHILGLSFYCGQPKAHLCNNHAV